jgi:hypothetical protein
VAASVFCTAAFSPSVTQRIVNIVKKIKPHILDLNAKFLGKLIIETEVSPLNILFHEFERSIIIVAYDPACEPKYVPLSPLLVKTFFNTIKPSFRSQYN